MSARAGSRSPVGALRSRAVRVQLPLVLLAVPLIAGIDGVTIAPAVVDAISADGEGLSSADMLDAVQLAIGLTVGTVLMAMIAAIAVLRRSIRHVVDELVAATRAIAAGDLQHRIVSHRSDEFGQLASAIDAMAGRLHRLEQARRRTLACVSHELRTPLTIIQGHAFTLSRDEVDPVRLDRFQLVQDESQRLAALVTDLLDASSLHAGGVRLAIEPCNLADIVQEEASRFAQQATSRGVVIELGGKRPHVEASVDRGRIAQALSNLLENAMRHARDGSVVRVVVDAARGSNAARSIVVENECDPIPRDRIGVLFEPFVQLDGARSGSVGLGLSIAQAIVEAHGGRIDFDADAAAEGIARVSVLLPAPAAESPQRTRVALGGMGRLASADA